MNNQVRDILDYVGDDGEFLQPIAAYMEEVAIDQQFYDENYPPFRANSDWHIWNNSDYQKFKAEHIISAVTQLLKLFARLLVTIMFYGFLLGLNEGSFIAWVDATFFASGPASDTEILTDHRSRILDETMPYQKCAVTGIPAETDRPDIYRVTATDIVKIGSLSDVQNIEVYAPQDDTNWYQLALAYPAQGEGIVLARDFQTITCEAQ